MPSTTRKEIEHRSGKAVRSTTGRAQPDIVVRGKVGVSPVVIKATRSNRPGMEERDVTTLTTKDGVVIEIYAGKVVRSVRNTFHASAAPIEVEPEYRTYSPEEIMSDRAADFFNSLVD